MGWTLLQMEALSWLNIAVSIVVLATAFLFDLPDWTFWTAVLVASIVLVLEAFDEFSEQEGLGEWVVGPESVVLVAGLWLAGTVLVTGGPATFVALAFIGGIVMAAASLGNAILSYRMDPTRPGDEQR